jgi:hypothetical protein
MMKELTEEQQLRVLPLVAAIHDRLSAAIGPVPDMIAEVMIDGFTKGATPEKEAVTYVNGLLAQVVGNIVGQILGLYIGAAWSECQCPTCAAKRAALLAHVTTCFATGIAMHVPGATVEVGVGGDSDEEAEKKTERFTKNRFTIPSRVLI